MPHRRVDENHHARHSRDFNVVRRSAYMCQMAVPASVTRRVSEGDDQETFDIRLERPGVRLGADLSLDIERRRPSLTQRATGTECTPTIRVVPPSLRQSHPPALAERRRVDNPQHIPRHAIALGLPVIDNGSHGTLVKILQPPAQ